MSPSRRFRASSVGARCLAEALPRQPLGQPGEARHAAESTNGIPRRLQLEKNGAETHLYRFNAALPDERRAASSSWDSDPHFSPDGRRLAFSSGRSGGFAVWVAAADGSGAQQLTHGIEGGWGGSSSWAPDVRTIAFDKSDPPDAHSHIWTVDVDGGAIRQITKGADDQMAPTWSGDGRWIYYSARQERGLEIWRVPVAGGQPQQVTRGGSGYLGIESFDGAGLLYQLKPQQESALLLQPCPAVSYAQLSIASDSMPSPLRGERSSTCRANQARRRRFTPST
jgi:dipeptidyl aminopeptidase/acylaminoacyl peptidase